MVKKEEKELESINQRMEYENVSKYFINCKAHGQSDDKCRILHPELR